MTETVILAEPVLMLIIVLALLVGMLAGFVLSRFA